MNQTWAPKLLNVENLTNIHETTCNAINQEKLIHQSKYIQ